MKDGICVLLFLSAAVVYLYSIVDLSSSLYVSFGRRTIDVTRYLLTRPLGYSFLRFWCMWMLGSKSDTTETNTQCREN